MSGGKTSAVGSARILIMDHSRDMQTIWSPTCHLSKNSGWKLDHSVLTTGPTVARSFPDYSTTTITALLLQDATAGGKFDLFIFVWQKSGNNLMAFQWLVFLYIQSMVCFTYVCSRLLINSLQCVWHGQKLCIFAAECLCWLLHWRKLLVVDCAGVPVIAISLTLCLILSCIFNCHCCVWFLIFAIGPIEGPESEAMVCQCLESE